MFKNEFKRLLHSKATLIILVLTAISVVSFIVSYGEKQIFIKQYNTDFGPDLNRNALFDLIQRYSEIKFLFDFWFESDFSEIFTYTLYLWTGVFLSAENLRNRNGGYGCFLVTRKKYKTVFFSTIGAQASYIFFVVATTTILQYIIATAIGGLTFYNVSIGEYAFSSLQTFFIILWQIFNISAYAILASLIATTISSIINNRYIIQSLPLLLFAILPMILSVVLGNISDRFARIVIYFEPYNVNTAISNIYQSNLDIKEIILNIFPLAVYSVIFLIFSAYDIRKNTREYL